MGDNSAIEWTDATWNPVRGCSIVSKGCTNCYAMRQAHRSSGAGGAYEGLTKLSNAGPVWTGAVRTVPSALLDPKSWKRPRRIFVNSMSDLFHEGIPDDFIRQVWTTMADCQRHIFQILTKRPERMRDYLLKRLTIGRYVARPLPNVWLGVSVEDQAAADERIPLLLQTPAAVRWISAEPLLGPIDVASSLAMNSGLSCRDQETEQPCPFCGAVCDDDSLCFAGPDNGIHWVVAGGESGPGARPMHPDSARGLRDQCANAGVPFFFKQWGSWAPVVYADATTGHRLIKLTFTDREKAIGGPAEGTTPWNVRRVGKKAAGRELDGRTHDEYPATGVSAR